MDNSLTTLAQKIRTIVENNRTRGLEALSRLLVETYWGVGQIMAENAEEALSENGLLFLSQNTGLEQSLLNRCANFFQTWPLACPSGEMPGLTWSHYKLLLPLSAEERAHYLTQADVQDWSVRELSQNIKDDTFALVTAVAAATGPRTLKRRDNRLHIYKSLVTHVADGDTIVVDIDLGFEVWIKRRLRLRGIDCPETGTPDGERAATFTRNVLPCGSTVVIQTFAVDLHGRYVADVFFLPGEDDKERIFTEGRFLNQELLDQGLAEPM